VASASALAADMIESPVELRSWADAVDHLMSQPLAEIGVARGQMHSHQQEQERAEFGEMVGSPDCRYW